MNAYARSIVGRYSRQGLWSLFLVCIFPFHFWTLALAIRDMSWAMERTNLWDAIGLASYGLIFALTESVIIFCIVIFIGFIIPQHWSVDKRIALLCLLFLLTSAWAMIAQLFFLLNVSLPIFVLKALSHSAHPLRMLYAGALATVVSSILLPVILYMRSGRAISFMKNVIERLAFLSIVYLFFDLVGLIIILARNFT